MFAWWKLRTCDTLSPTALHQYEAERRRAPKGTLQDSLVLRCTGHCLNQLYWEGRRSVNNSFAHPISRVDFRSVRATSQTWLQTSHRCDTVWLSLERTELLEEAVRELPSDHINFVHGLWKSTKKLNAELSPLQKCLVVPASGRFCYSRVSQVHTSRLTAVTGCSNHGWNRQMQEELLSQSIQERHHVAANTQTKTMTICPRRGDTSISSPQMVHRGENFSPEATCNDITIRQSRFKATEELRPLATTSAHTSESKTCTYLLCCRTSFQEACRT